MNNKNTILLSAILIINIIILVVVLSINDAKLNDMQNSLDNMQNSLDYQHSNITNNLYNQISSLEQTILQTKEEELNLLSEYTLITSKPDMETLLSEVTLKIKPKTYSESTTAVFYFDGRHIDMKRNGNEFTGTISVSISKSYNDASVSLTQNGITQTQGFTDIVTFYEYFGKTDAHFQGEKKYSDNSLEINGTVNYTFSSPVHEKVKSAHIYGIVNKNTRVFLEELDKNNLSNQKFSIKDSFTMNEGDKLEIYINIITTNDTNYICYAEGIQIEENGQLSIYNVIPVNIIYDKFGNEILLY